jgi:hypothetical protein
MGRNDAGFVLPYVRNDSADGPGIAKPKPENGKPTRVVKKVELAIKRAFTALPLHLPI